MLTGMFTPERIRCKFAACEHWSGVWTLTREFFLRTNSEKLLPWMQKKNCKGTRSQNLTSFGSCWGVMGSSGLVPKTRHKTPNKKSVSCTTGSAQSSIFYPMIRSTLLFGLKAPLERLENTANLKVPIIQDRIQDAFSSGWCRSVVCFPFLILSPR